MDNFIYIKGARANNLKGVNCIIPHDRMTVVSGVSGSGKSSLVFDTLYAEGQRRYVESLSSYARQFLEKMAKPDVDGIDGISPAIAVQQRNTIKGKRSTVGTSTEINDYLRLLFSRAATAYCVCGGLVTEMTAPNMTDGIIVSYKDRTVIVAFPVSVSGGDAAAELFDRLLMEGYFRIFRDGRIYDIREERGFSSEGKMYVAVDRLRIDERHRSRIAESVEAALREGSGSMTVIVSGEEQKNFSSAFSCSRCGKIYLKPVPLQFSFNNPLGACPECNGFGNTLALDYVKIIPDESISLEEGAVEPFNMPSGKAVMKKMLDFAARNNIPTDVPFSSLKGAELELLKKGGKGFPGIEGFFARLEAKKYKLHVRVFISRYRKQVTCSLCSGKRLNPEAENFRIGGKSITDISDMTITEAGAFFADLNMEGAGGKVIERIVREVNRRLSYLDRVGLGYLTLSRLSSTLSGGEAQRISLASILGASLVGITVILDEPTIGLHPSDNRRLISILHSLRDQGNTMVVVEHDMEVISSADYVIEVGPGAGEKGGEIVFQGPFSKLEASKNSLTAAYLSGRLDVPAKLHKGPPASRKISIKGASENNLKNIDVDIPLGGIVCVAGVSGSGKSTLVQDILFSSYKNYKGLQVERVGNCKSVSGFDLIDDMIMVDQAPIGRSRRSNPATFLKAFDGIRRAFASTKAAKVKGLTASSFSFNTKGGRCEECEGLGTVEVDMQFLPAVTLLCDSCEGMRYRKDVLDIRYAGYNIFDVLSMTVDEAVRLFSPEQSVIRKLTPFIEVGLGYIKLGQSAETLSGGEAQRMKLASFLSMNDELERLFLFDEPTTGLHLHDIERLLSCLRKLVRKGNSVLVIEHNIEVLKNADHIIELGPEGGERGGFAVGRGTPEQLAGQQTPTAEFLKQIFGDQAE